MTFMYIYTYLYKYTWLTTLVPFLLIALDIAKRDQQMPSNGGHFLAANQEWVHKRYIKDCIIFKPTFLKKNNTQRGYCFLNVCFGFNHEVGFMTHDP